MCVCAVLGLEPSFDVPIVNVTVVAGQTAVLPCSVDVLGKYKVYHSLCSQPPSSLNYHSLHDAGWRHVQLAGRSNYYPFG